MSTHRTLSQPSLRRDGARPGLALSSIFAALICAILAVEGAASLLSGL